MQTDSNRTETEPANHRRRSQGLKVILLVVAVVVVIVLASVFWFVLTLGLYTDGNLPPSVSISHSKVSNGFKWSFGYWAPKDALPVSWSELEIVLTDGLQHASWINMSAEDVDDGTLVTHSYGSRDFGEMIVFLNITDLEGNGIADFKDSFEITVSGGVFSSGDIYLLFVVYKPTSDRMGWDYIYGGV